MLALLLFCTTKKILKSSGGLPFGIGMNEAYLRSCNKITDEHVIINISFVEQLTLLLSWVIKTGILVDSIPNSTNLHHKNCMANSKENYYYDLGIYGVK